MSLFFDVGEYIILLPPSRKLEMTLPLLDSPLTSARSALVEAVRCSTPTTSS